MPSTDRLLAQLGDLLTENSIGTARLTPRPRGGRLTGDPRRTLEQTLDSLEASPAARVTLVYGNGCFAVGRYAEAAVVCQGILESDPNDIDVRFNLALAHLRLRDARQAVEDLTRVLAQAPSLPEAHYQLGNAYDDMGEGELALAGYDQAIALQPGYLQAIYNKGVILAKLGRHQEAVVEPRLLEPQLQAV